MDQTEDPFSTRVLRNGFGRLGFWVGLLLLCFNFFFVSFSISASVAYKLNYKLNSKKKAHYKFKLIGPCNSKFAAHYKLHCQKKIQKPGKSALVLHWCGLGPVRVYPVWTEARSIRSTVLMYHQIWSSVQAGPV